MAFYSRQHTLGPGGYRRATTVVRAWPRRPPAFCFAGPTLILVAETPARGACEPKAANNVVAFGDGAGRDDPARGGSGQTAGGFSAFWLSPWPSIGAGRPSQSRQTASEPLSSATAPKPHTSRRSSGASSRSESGCDWAQSAVLEDCSCAHSFRQRRRRVRAPLDGPILV
jgi:hypothetical protein